MKFFAAILLTLCSVASSADSIVRYKYTYFQNESKDSRDLVTGWGTAWCFLSVNANISLMLTCEHNIMDEEGHIYKNMFVELQGNWFKCSVLEHDSNTDIALISVAGFMDPMILKEEDLRDKDSFEFYGAPQSKPIRWLSGKLLEKRASSSCKDLVKLPICHGDSGGPCIKDGKVVGIITSGPPVNGDLDGEHGYIVPVSVLKDLLIRWSKTIDKTIKKNK